MKLPNQVLPSIKTNSRRICFTFYCQYWFILYTYTVYEIYHDVFPSFFSHVTILIKHKLKEPFSKNYSVIPYVCDSTLKNAREMTFLYMLNCNATINFVMTKLTLSIKQSRYLIFLVVPSFVSLFSGNQNDPLYFVQVKEKGTAKKRSYWPI